MLFGFWILSIEIRLKKMFKGKKAGDLESIIHEINNEVKNLNISREEIEKYLETVEKRLQKSVQKINVVRFNPFENSGSNQSFAIAFLNEQGDGAIISSLYSREKVSIYAKPIKNYESEYALSKEEKQSMEETRFDSAKQEKKND